MKQLQIELNNKEKLILVELPIGASNMRNVKLESGQDAVVLGTYLPRTGEIDFEVKEEWVKPKVRLNIGTLEYRYFYYDSQWDFVAISLEQSLISLLKSETEKAFPLKEMPKQPNMLLEFGASPEAWGRYNKAMIDWQESESKVMPHKFVVLKINEQS